MSFPPSDDRKKNLTSSDIFQLIVEEKQKYQDYQKLCQAMDIQPDETATKISSARLNLLMKLYNMAGGAQ